jgi:hypothetical protein
VQYVLHFIVIADQLQQRLAAGARLAYAQQVLCGWIDGFDEQVAVDNDDGGIEVFEYRIGSGWRPAAAGLP